MERRGLVVTSTDPLDRRGRRINLTDKGEAVRAQVISGRRQLLEDSLGDLQLEPATIATLHEIADRLGRLL